jgi:hypothetical protein
MSEFQMLPDETAEPKSGLHLLFVDGAKEPNSPGLPTAEAAVL